MRVLAEDIAERSARAHVSALRRSWVEPFEQEPMETLAALQDMRARGEWPALLAPDAPAAASASGHPERHRCGSAFSWGQRVFADWRGRTACAPVRPRPARSLALGAADGAGGLEPRRLMRGAPG